MVYVASQGKPAVDNVWSLSWSQEVVQVPNEGNDGVRTIWYSKVWPPRVVELFHQPTMSSSPCDLE